MSAAENNTLNPNSNVNYELSAWNNRSKSKADEKTDIEMTDQNG